ncbi:hypothetical protein [Chitinophaga barathri]|uniref:Uncharacterized protein n=1 Tax=Chitinophaga barathri TaxID=1647451 RepID=A0A3N4MFP9_9BACT|nr:hypothetical protein [Chitinophaga barathri]RPD42784.1 hypothetical protein EG028_00350 [Chitinophaga barathri]
MLKDPPPLPPSAWNSLFTQLSAQGSTFNTPLSASDWYFAFLSSVDQDEKNGLYYVMFEVVPKEWVDNVIMSGDADISTLAPVSPASCYWINGVTENVILNALGLKSPDELAVGSWYVMQLKKGTSGISGDLYDPDLDMEFDT